MPCVNPFNMFETITDNNNYLPKVFLYIWYSAFKYITKASNMNGFVKILHFLYS